ncbi:MAG TPA: alkaline phosphatase family protein [Candidatus Rubrimentiphilum sp.]|nr:alkaline phosphatase family protein [Candidatus Rubrimentiphilum sp.]
MLRAILLSATAAVSVFALAEAAPQLQSILPSGWRLTQPAGALATVGTMPQGIALSPDGKTLAVVESGVNPAALRLLDAKTLATIKVVTLNGAFGKPVWCGAGTVCVPGAATDAIQVVDATSGAIEPASLAKGAWPVSVTLFSSRQSGQTVPSAVTADDHNSASGGTITIGQINNGGITFAGQSIVVGSHPAAALGTSDGKYIYVALRGQSSVAVVDPVAAKVVQNIAVGKHPCDLALSNDGTALFVAVCDDDAVAVIDTRTNRRVVTIPVGMHAGRVHGYGANPNALLVHGNDLFVSLGGENAIAHLRDGRVIGYIPAGWYPTGLAMGNDGTLYVSDGKGETAPANPQFNIRKRSAGGYVGAITAGSVRAIPRSAYDQLDAMTAQAVSDLMPLWTPRAPAQTILRAHGPISHVIYIIKENRSYDQVLGDIKSANGDPSLVNFGQDVTPNQHALALRFGVMDNAYADAQVSADGHNWTDAATVSDYVERTWPVNYGNRREGFDSQNGVGAPVPHSGYLWDDAKRAGITYRDYGEDMMLSSGPPIAATDHPALQGHYDPAFVGWNLKYSDQDRYTEWRREFERFVANRNLPQLEIVYFPNDHTSGTAPNAPTPEAYVATNDWVVGQLVDAVSHSPYWKSTAIFVLEDDAQNGPDHVSDQRSTFYIASPYARGGVDHTHYSTVSFLRSIELLLGLAPLSVADTTTQPLYKLFALNPVNAAPYNAIKPSIDMTAVNKRAAYGSAISAHLDWSKPDMVDPRVLNDILRHAARRR